MAHDGNSRGPRDRAQADLLEIDADMDARGILEFDSPAGLSASIKVIGVGGAGGNAINTMIDAGLAGVEFVAANTDAQALQHSRAPIRLQLGADSTRGLGCGANPDKGRQAALENRERLRDMLIGTDMVFVTAGMGGGTGTGAAPIVAEVAREVGALTVAVVTRPFQFEGRVRSKHAERGLDELHRVVDTLITIPNHRLLALAGKQTAMRDAFKLADEVLLNAVRGISDLITVHGLINLDFADVRTIMSEMGMALMGTGVGRGESCAAEAARGAIASPLLEDLSIDGARGVLINITGSSKMSLFEVNEAAMLVQEAAHEDANIIFGAVVDDGLAEGEMRVTVIATGLDDGRLRRTPPGHRETGFGDAGRSRWQDEAATEPAAVRMHRRAEAVSSMPLEEVEVEPMRAVAAGGGGPVFVGGDSTTGDSLGVLGGAEGELLQSPFAEDEYDVPAFLRRQGPGARRDGV